MQKEMKPAQIASEGPRHIVLSRISRESRPDAMAPVACLNASVMEGS